ncbi:Hsp20 family protein [Bdellovibrionota bacterium FG-2]
MSSITPTPTTPRSPNNSSGVTPRTKSQVSDTETPADQKASAAEKEARNRVLQAHKQVERTQQEESFTLDQIKDQYSKMRENEAEKQDSSLKTQRERGYSRIRELQRQQQAELNRVKREGERTLAETKNYYSDTLYGTETKGREQLDSLLSQNGMQREVAQKEQQMLLEDLQQKHVAQTDMLRNTTSLNMNQTTEAADKEFERIAANARAATEQTREHFEQRTKELSENQRTDLAHMQSQTAQKLRETRLDTSSKLAAYSSRQEDPFYKLMRIDAKLSDEGDSFVLRAQIPEHEQKNVTLSVRGDNLVLSGFRRNQEKLDLAPGHTQNSQAFQSFSESFPLPWPVDGKKLAREFKGDTLVVTVPKKNTYAFREKAQKELAERAVPDRPHFPENIPIKKFQDTNGKESESSGEAPSVSTRTLG